ncbi:MAG: AAA family ATPase [Euryarchaeota archaeon]|nr:AAA family ATPase [Euryarchaeota archaeon]MDE1836431.1 AAA family ATPase [Euryarchaeota archaeon]MDE1879054.1 AAA family ATPase [Euryarchaeota archaeon]MDE2044179.1 AAA family ATPase [Thermoplasmata archaeon]
MSPKPAARPPDPPAKTQPAPDTAKAPPPQAPAPVSTPTPPTDPTNEAKSPSANPPNDEEEEEAGEGDASEEAEEVEVEAEPSPTERPGSAAAAPTHQARVPIRSAHWELHPVAPPTVFVAKRITPPGSAGAPASEAPQTPSPAVAATATSPPSSPASSPAPPSASSARPPPPPPVAPPSSTSARPPAQSASAATISAELAVPAAPSRAGAATPGPRAAPASPSSEAASDAQAVLKRVQTNIGNVVIGYEGIVRAMLVAIAANGHILLEGVPGLAKTYLVRAFSRSLTLTFRRIQFTPDMLPADILGTVVLDPRTQMFEFRPGPIFANVILADEINRAPPKVQSALLEAMQERQVTVEGVSYPLPSPFVVIATENPVELEGTYPLPEAELDRFLFRILLGYPSAENELRLLKQRTVTNDPTLTEGILGAPALIALRDQAQAIHVHDDILRYIAALLRETRTDPRVLSGASPRAGVQLLLAVKASALFAGRPFVIPDDVKDLAFDVLNHRLVLRPEVLALHSGGGKDDGGRTLQEVVFSLINKVAVPW